MNCKPGDLAIIVRVGKLPENIGKIVEIIRPAVSGEDFRIEGNPRCMAWMVRGYSPLARRTYEGKPLSAAFEIAAYDDSLLPITGLPITDDVTDEVTA